METTKLRRFAQYARRSLIEQTSAKLEFVLAEDSSARREFPKAVADLEKQVALSGREQVIEKVAYTWFNRFCALRFMDLNGYNRIRVISPADESQFQPEILAEAKAGHLDDEMIQESHRQQISNLLSATSSSSDPQQEAYRILIVSACNYWHKSMSFMFEKIEDFTELLIPSDLLSGNSILAFTREAMTPDVCKDVEVIGWLYQFYISEKKDQVFDALKKNKKVEPENIPAATQLFTPHWIVRYLVENSLGRLWMLNHPNSNLAKYMDFYIKPEQPETDFLIIKNPEELKICDPACGSGHMLTYAFDLLYVIYEEFGTDPSEIPEKILNYNLFGIEIDPRAGELAAVALTMKARSKQRRFFNKNVKPNICVLQKVTFDCNDLNEYESVVGKDLFTTNLRKLLAQFEEADNFGSLIRPVTMNYAKVRQLLEAKGIGGQLLLEHIHNEVLRTLEQAEYLSQRYEVVVANPPYMGAKGMNVRLSAWVKEHYPDSKSDLFAMFVERNLDLAVKFGNVGMITMQSWMFLSSYEKLRAKILTQETILSMAHLGTRAFDSIGGEVVSTTAFVLKNNYYPGLRGDFFRLIEGQSEAEKENLFLKLLKDRSGHNYHTASSGDFGKIPCSPIAYWAGVNLRNSFVVNENIGKIAKPRQGMATTNNDLFLRLWSEVQQSKIKFDAASEDEAAKSGYKWFPYNKGGSFRKWYGNFFFVVNFENRGEEICSYIDNTVGAKVGSNGRVINREYYFKPCITWSDITAGGFGARLSPKGFVFDVKGSSGFPDEDIRLSVLGLLSSKLTATYMSVLNPTVTFQVGDISRIPFKKVDAQSVVMQLVELSKVDWDSYETSWDFTSLPLLQPIFRQASLSLTYSSIRKHWQNNTDDMLKLEQANNKAFIDVYGLQDELDEGVNLKEITLFCNPYSRYPSAKNDVDRESRLLSDTIREFISYAVGCMFGRYSLDKEGLILANQDQSLQDYKEQIPKASFMPDEDNVIPMLDGDWFNDDITERFRLFLKVTFGEEKYEENLDFIETALGEKGKPLSIREYFLKDFYNDHVKRYKKRPIYWMFSSPKGSFNALIYMHRYRPDTVSVVLSDYLREFRTKLNARKSHLEQVSISGNASAGEKAKAIKEIENLKKVLVELEDYERDVMYPLATRQLEIDLDDGVKKNYGMFGAALKKIVGLDAQDD